MSTVRAYACAFLSSLVIDAAPCKGMSNTTSPTRLKWLTVKDYEIEREHKTLADAVFWAQGTHCTDARPRREGVGYKIGRTAIVKRSDWERWLNPNR